ncbi:MAG: hypothetical protein AAF433_15885 [Bacteroidota bacterium]
MKKLPPQILLSLRALAFYLLLFRREWLETLWFQLPYLPFIPFFDQIPTGLFCLPLIVIVYLAPFAILLNYRAALAARCLGIGLLLSLLSSMPLFGNSKCFLACLFLLGGSYQVGGWIYQMQLFLLYFGAGLNKLLQADWWNGYYFDFFAAEVFELAGYRYLTQYVDALLVAKISGILILLFELLLGLLFCFRAQIGLAIFLGFSFHVLMLLLSWGYLSFHFFFVSSVAYYLLFSTTKQSVGFGNKWMRNNLNIRLMTVLWVCFLLLQLGAEKWRYAW